MINLFKKDTRPPEMVMSEAKRESGEVIGNMEESAEGLVKLSAKAAIDDDDELAEELLVEACELVEVAKDFKSILYRIESYEHVVYAMGSLGDLVLTLRRVKGIVKVPDIRNVSTFLSEFRADLATGKRQVSKLRKDLNIGKRKTKTEVRTDSSASTKTLEKLKEVRTAEINRIGTSSDSKTNPSGGPMESIRSIISEENKGGR